MLPLCAVHEFCWCLFFMDGRQLYFNFECWSWIFFLNCKQKFYMGTVCAWCSWIFYLRILSTNIGSWILLVDAAHGYYSWILFISVVRVKCPLSYPYSWVVSLYIAHEYWRLHHINHLIWLYISTLLYVCYLHICMAYAHSILHLFIFVITGTYASNIPLDIYTSRCLIVLAYYRTNYRVITFRKHKPCH